MSKGCRLVFFVFADEKDLEVPAGYQEAIENGIGSMNACFKSREALRGFLLVSYREA